MGNSPKFSLKDSVRDSYVPAIFHVYKDEIAALDPNASDYNEKFSELYRLILAHNDKAALEIANIYMQHHDHKYLEIYRGRNKNV